MFVVNNIDLYQTNSEVYGIGTRYVSDHQPLTNLTKYKNGVYYSRIKIFNNVSQCSAVWIGFE